MTIAVDFDGTLCKADWPRIGRANTQLIDWLIDRQRAGDRLIFWSCRCGEMLEAALDWCAARGLCFDAVNENLPENVEKYGNDCRKVFADVYLDDKAGYVCGISPWPVCFGTGREYANGEEWTAM